MCKIFGSLICAVLVLLMGSAVAEFDPTEDLSLTISCQEEAGPLVGAAFDLYRIASLETDGSFAMAAPFDGYGIDIQAGDASVLKAAASTLEGYILRDNIAPMDHGVTDARGMLRFPNRASALEPGLYLVVAHRHIQDGITYEMHSFIVQLPSWSEVGGEWVYDVKAYPKQDPRPDMPETITRKALKVWNDAGYEAERPKEIVVYLLRDGEVYDTVTLNAEGNWRYVWEGLDPEAYWSIAEEVPKGYTHQIVREGITFVITNSYAEEPPEPTDRPTDDPNVTPGPDAPQTPGPTAKPTAKPTARPEDDKPGDTKLPQTGVLWWPVPALVSAGLLLIVIGLIRRRGV